MEHNRLIWLESPRQRLKEWRTFRTELATMDIPVALSLVAKWWSTVPIGARSIDPYDHTAWPTAWELLYENSFCEHSRGVGIYYTLHYAGVENLEVQLVSDDVYNDLLTIVLVDNTHVLNYTHGTVEHLKDIQSNFRVLEKFPSKMLTK